MSRIFVDVGMSLDGYIAGPDRRPDNPLGDGGLGIHDAVALERAKAAAGGKDVRIGGGADTMRQFLRAGVVDEITVHIAPLLLGSGLRLFDGDSGPTDLRFAQVETSGSEHVTHIRYRVLRGAQHA